MTKRMKRKSMYKKSKRRSKRKVNKYTKLSKVQCLDIGTDCIIDDKVTLFD